jgi:hypothetical protein
MLGYRWRAGLPSLPGGPVGPVARTPEALILRNCRRLALSPTELTLYWFADRAAELDSRCLSAQSGERGYLKAGVLQVILLEGDSNYCLEDKTPRDTSRNFSRMAHLLIWDAGKVFCGPSSGHRVFTRRCNPCLGLVGSRVPRSWLHASCMNP